MLWIEGSFSGDHLRHRTSSICSVCSRRFRDMSRLGTNDNIPPPVMAGDRDLEPDNMISMQDVNSTNDMNRWWEGRRCVWTIHGPAKDIHGPSSTDSLLCVCIRKTSHVGIQIRNVRKLHGSSQMVPYVYWHRLLVCVGCWETIHDAIKPEKRKEFYENYCHWFPSMACEDHMDMFIETAVNLSPTAWNPLRECCMNRLMYDESLPVFSKRSGQEPQW